jgi:hypothetical protein
MTEREERLAVGGDAIRVVRDVEEFGPTEKLADRTRRRRSALRSFIVLTATADRCAPGRSGSSSSDGSRIRSRRLSAATRLGAARRSRSQNVATTQEEATHDADARRAGWGSKRRPLARLAPL